MTQFLIDTGPSERGVHRLESASHCAQLYAFKYKLKLIQATAPLIRGTLGHVGLAHYYARMAAVQRNMDPEMYFSPLDAIDEKVRRMVEAKEPGYLIAIEHQEQMKTALTGYMAHYAMDKFTVWAIEHVVRMHFHGYLLTQRFDLVVRDNVGKFWIYDHKFVGAIQRKSTTRYTLSPQFLEMYHQGVNAYGDKFGGLRVNLVGVDNVTYERNTPEPAPFALNYFPRYVQQTEQRIESWEPLDPWDYPKSYGEQTCMTPYGPCPATEACRWGPGANDTMEAP